MAKTERKRRPLTPRQEAFAQALATGISQAEAFRRASPSSLKWRDATVWSKASVLAKHAGVKARVAELQERGAQSAVYTLADHLRRLDELSRKAENASEFHAAVKAEEARGRAAGFYVQKTEVTGKDGGPIETKQTRDLTDDELKAELLKHGIQPGIARTAH